MPDIVHSLMQVDDSTWTIVIAMALTGAYLLNYIDFGTGSSIAGFAIFAFSSLAVLAVMRAYGISFTFLRGGDAVIGASIGMSMAVLAMIALYALFARKDRPNRDKPKTR